MPIHNDEELNRILLMELSEIIDEVAFKLWEEIRDLIQTHVYDAGYPSWYNRQEENGGLFDSFVQEQAKIMGQRVEAEVWHNPMQMTLDPSNENKVHGSLYFPITDVREFLADMIINGGDSKKSPHVGPLFGEDGWWREPRDFWTPVLELVNNGTMDKWIEKSFSDRNIIWIKK